MGQGRLGSFGARELGSFRGGDIRVGDIQQVEGSFQHSKRRGVGSGDSLGRGLRGPERSAAAGSGHCSDRTHPQ
jgi:hypothetical protein